MRLGLAAAVLVAVLVGAATAVAAPGRLAVGVADEASADAVAAAVEAVAGAVPERGLAELGALVVTVADVAALAPALRALPGVDYVEEVTPTRSLAFRPSDPLVDVQWYLDAVQAFDYWASRPVFGGPVLVAVIDSGIDEDHPDLAGQIAASATFVGGRAGVDTVGHGTFVAGEIAAVTDNQVGIAGIGLPVRLLVGKVVGPDGGISVEAEAEAIKWAVDQGARVVNLSLGGTRDPRNPAFDTYSELEQDAVNYAYRNGAVVVAATGNCESVCPWPYASYPAALPHVLGVSALAVDDATPEFSNRDPVFNDLAAPGLGIVSTFPPDLTDVGCGQIGYSLCAGNDLRDGAGTSFAAPIVSAAAAVMLAVRPDLHPSQVMAILERAAEDLPPAGRDALSGNGRVNLVNALNALTLPPPPADSLETNDDAGGRAASLYFRSARTVRATVDYFNDPRDVYRVYLRPGQRLQARVSGLRGRTALVVWRPGTPHVVDVTAVALRSGAIAAYSRRIAPRVSLRVKRAGWYYVEVKAPDRGSGSYALALVKR